MIMGRRTFDSIGRALPGRTSIVLSRQASIPLPIGVLLAHSWGEALERANGSEEVFVIGGAQIYAIALPHAHRIHLTRVDAQVEGDVCFPVWQMDRWKLISSEHYPADERNDFYHAYEVYERSEA